MAQLLIFVILALAIQSSLTFDVQPLSPKKNTDNQEKETHSKKDADTGVVHNVSIEGEKPANIQAVENKNIQAADNKNIQAADNKIISNNKSQNPTTEKVNFNNVVKPPNIESGAVKRGVLVFVGISMIFMVYVAIKTYRNRKKPNVVVRKYGIRTRRSDLEMRPLPLDDDEEDDTVFDLKNVNRI